MQRYTTEYDAQAGEFMRKWGVKIHRHFVGKMRYFPNDREPRNVWAVSYTHLTLPTILRV